MKKISIVLSVAALPLLSSSAALAFGTNTYIGAQLGLTDFENANNSISNSFDLYGAMVGTSISDKFSVDLNVVSEGLYIHGMGDVYFDHPITDKLTSRFGGGIGAVYFKSKADYDSETKFAYQGIAELQYAINDSIGIFSGYHYVGFNSDSDVNDHANEYLFGMHYYL